MHTWIDSKFAALRRMLACQHCISHRVTFPSDIANPAQEHLRQLSFATQSNLTQTAELSIPPLAGAAAANGSSNGTAALQHGAELARGQVWFVPAGTAVEVSVSAQASQPLVMWAAACNAKVRHALESVASVGRMDQMIPTTGF